MTGFLDYVDEEGILKRPTLTARAYRIYGSFALALAAGIAIAVATGELPRSSRYLAAFTTACSALIFTFATVQDLNGRIAELESEVESLRNG